MPSLCPGHLRISGASKPPFLEIQSIHEDRGKWVSAQRAEHGPDGCFQKSSPIPLGLPVRGPPIAPDDVRRVWAGGHPCMLGQAQRQGHLLRETLN